jgi:aminoglycoside phosphotransferase
MRYGLAQLLGQCLSVPAPPVGIELLRTKFKPGRKLSAYYRVNLGDETRSIAVDWFAEPGPPPVNAGEINDEAARRHLLAPFTQLAARTGDGQAALRVAPGDPQMPQLVRLSQHDYLMGMLSDLTADAFAFPAAADITTVRYRPGQRHVLQVIPMTDRKRPSTFIKIDRENSGPRAIRFAEVIGPILAEQCPRASLAQPLGYSVPDKASAWKQAPGLTLAQAARVPGRDITPLVALMGGALRVIHESEMATAGAEAQGVGQRPVPHSAQAEAVATIRAGHHIEAMLPEVGTRYRLLTTEVVDRLDALPQEKPSLTHGDVKCDNLVADADRICLLDLDRSGLADPAMDLGKFLADLRWWCRSSVVDVTPLARALVAGYGSCPPARWSRARLLAVLFQLKLAARRSPVHAMDWASQVTSQVADAAASLDAERAA